MQTNEPPEKPVEKKLLTIADFLAEFNIGRTKFYQEVKKGRLKIGHPLGKRTFIKRKDAEDWFKALKGDSE